MFHSVGESRIYIVFFVSFAPFGVVVVYLFFVFRASLFGCGHGRMRIYA
jgi:hypothetical protein